jgi:hypothetical protein
MRKAFAITLASIMLIFSANVGVAYHFCGGKLAKAKLVLGSGTADCGMESNLSSCENQKGTSFSSIPCCLDHLKEFSVDNFQFNGSSTLASHIFELSHFTIIDFSSDCLGSAYKSFSYGSPPGITSVSLSAFQVFII